MEAESCPQSVHHERIEQEGDREGGHYHQACDYYCYEEQEVATVELLVPTLWRGNGVLGSDGGIEILEMVSGTKCMYVYRACLGDSMLVIIN